ncbi:hypothetical protein IGI04_012989 [Brassica rapa subsp. trilocularis]|uniref:Zinc finger GRF-type domain-containing protein n=1 Tax=Brassica rapa subsp. trilocularis TaxID=1813537 RepID=A0ABQ7N9X0_BRACM|nr:hypothetical protein IGI04_012989 [Brassica rapa subsp. trilocularis]
MTHPDEEYSHMKALKRHNDMLGFVADAQYGVPTKCPCGGGIIPEVSPCNKFPNDFDTQPGRRYFTCKNFEDEVTKLVDRVKEMAEEIDRLKAQLYQLHRP